MPAAMLTSAVPLPIQRDKLQFPHGAGAAHSATPPAFDLLVLDEAPFLNWLRGLDGDQVVVPTTWLDPARSGLSDTAEQDKEIAKALGALSEVASALIAGGDAVRNYYSKHQGRDTDDEDPSFLSVADLLWNALGKMKVSPTVTGDELAAELSGRVQEMDRVWTLQRLLAIHQKILDGQASTACLVRTEMSDSTPAIGLRWREDIHATWLDNPVLYLDGTGMTHLVEPWLPGIETLVTAKAAAPHMRIVQSDDRAFGYSSMIAGSDPTNAEAAAGLQRRIFNLMEIAIAGTGGTGLLVGPKKLIQQMTDASLVPTGWQTATFGSLRGVDQFKDVSVAVIVSRQLPPPAQVELMTEVVFGQAVQRLHSDWYPSTGIVRVMSDGTGRQAEGECHPDPNVEVVRWTICNAEVIQAIGRVRGVRREATNPVVVFAMNNLDLYHLTVSELTTWDDLAAQCGPTILMAVRGCVPKMWSDIAHMVGRWSCSNDPAATARGWFRDNPAERNRLDDLFATGRITHPFTGTQMNFRRECFGLVGRNRRYVWVMDGMTVEEAGKMLPPVIAG